jgi:hypothetical protein
VNKEKRCSAEALILVGSRMGAKMLLKKVKWVTLLGGEFELVI